MKKIKFRSGEFFDVDTSKEAFADLPEPLCNFGPGTVVENTPEDSALILGTMTSPYCDEEVVIVGMFGMNPRAAYSIIERAMCWREVS